MKSIASILSPRGSKGRRSARKLDDEAIARATAKTKSEQRKREYVQWLAAHLPGFTVGELKDMARFKQLLSNHGIALTKTKTKVDGVEKFYIVLTEHGKEVSAFKLEGGE